MTVYEEIFEVIKERKKQFENGTAAENSYTCYLFDKGVDKICKKHDSSKSSKNVYFPRILKRNV